MRNRQLYQGDLLYVGPTGFTFATTGDLYAGGVGAGGNSYGNISGQIASGQSLIAEMFRIQSINDGWTKKLKVLNEFGQLAQVDLIPIEPPEGTFSITYVLANMVNENLMGFTVNRPGDSTQVSCISGILSQASSNKNYFIKTVTEGQDAISYNPSEYDVIAFGQAFISSYRTQGRVLDFPTSDVSFTSVNAQCNHIFQANTGGWAFTPAVNPGNGAYITGWGYQLPTGTTSFNGNGITTTNVSGLSVLRPGDINFSLGLGVGDGFSLSSDLKIQSYDISINFNIENLTQLGNKYYYAKLPRFPVEATMTVEALAGDFQTGILGEIWANNVSYNPLVTLNLPNTSIPVAAFQLKNAKIENQEYSLALNNNKTMRLTFRTVIGGPQDTTNGFFMSGIC
jgi:hypothetical protein